MYGQSCFENIMANSSLEKNCDCPLECDHNGYSFSLVSKPLDTDEMCSIGVQDNAMKEFYRKPFPPTFIRILRNAAYNETMDSMEICKRNVQYRAELTFQLAANTLPVTIISRRMSFFDKLSGFGKKMVSINPNDIFI